MALYLANTAWALASPAVEDVEPLEVEEYNHQGQANDVWALATLAVEDSGVLEAMRLAAVLHIWELTPHVGLRDADDGGL